MAGKKSSMGAFFLWFIMVVMVVVAVTEFYGPYQGWLLPTAGNVRDRVTEKLDDFEKKRKGEKEQRERDEDARKLAIAQKADAEKIAQRTRVIGLDEYPRTTMSDSALAYFQTDGEVTPADLTMQASVIPEMPKRKTAHDVLAQLNGRKLVKGSKEYKTYFAEIYANKLAELEKPQIGEAFTVKLRDESTFEGRLSRLKKDAAMFSDSNGAFREIVASKLSLKSLKELFPTIYSNKFAEHYMSKVTVRPQVVTKVDPATNNKLDPQTVASNDSHFDHEDKNPDTVVRNPLHHDGPRLPELKTYDPIYAKTPKHLATPIQYFGNWLDAQSKRQGGQIADKLYAKQHGSQVVLYMQMSRYFLAQKRDLKKMTCEQFWHMWSRECKNRGKVKDPGQAHVVMVDPKGKIVGGSQESRAQTIWVK